MQQRLLRWSQPIEQLRNDSQNALTEKSTTESFFEKLNPQKLAAQVAKNQLDNSAAPVSSPVILPVTENLPPINTDRVNQMLHNEIDIGIPLPVNKQSHNVCPYCKKTIKNDQIIENEQLKRIDKSTQTESILAMRTFYQNVEWMINKSTKKA